ncbi:MAG: tRNA-dihydrouridine synthase family protein [Proteobacteria bacterium]|nr:tRNA-dihydrouridine synthase family protein [Pseudomonadota bacterium]
MKDTPFLGARYFMGSVTNVANRPFRRLVTELGAEATIGEMAIAKYIAQGGKQDLALLKRDPHEKIFGAQIVGGNPKHLAKAAKLAEQFGADFVDFNCACPHQSVVSHGGGAYMLLHPDNLPPFLDAIRQAVSIPVSIKLRKGFDEGDSVAEEIADMAQKAGFNAIFIHGRTKAAQYRGNCDWELIERIASNSDIPVIGCGDLAHGSDVMKKIPETSCSGFAIARGALMKPWIFKEIQEKRQIDLTAEPRLELLKKLVEYTLEIFGNDKRGLDKSAKFLLKQLEFLVRYVPADVYGKEVPMQERAETWTPRNDLEALWANPDKDARTALLKLAGFPETPAECWKKSANSGTDDSEETEIG